MRDLTESNSSSMFIKLPNNSSILQSLFNARLGACNDVHFFFTYLQPFLLFTDHQKCCLVNLLASYGAAVGTFVFLKSGVSHSRNKLR